MSEDFTGFGQGQAPSNGFDLSFKSLGIGEGQVYADPLGMGDAKIPVDLREQARLIQAKAFNTQTGGAGTAGYAMIPVYVDPNIIDRTRKETPLVELIPKAANQGTTADFNVITAKGAADFKAEDAALVEQDDTYDRVSVPIKYAYSVGRVTGPSIAATPSYNLQMYNPSGSGLGGTPFASGAAPNAKQLEVLVKTRALMEEVEQVIVNGDAGTTPTEFSGIVTTQSTTNKVDLNTTAIDLDDIRTAIQYAYDDGGRPNIAVADSATYTDIQALIEDRMRTAPTTNIWGIDYITLQTMVGNIPIIPSRFLSTASGSKSIYFLDLSVWEQRVLMDTTYEELAKTSDAEKFMLKTYRSLICRAPTFNSFVGEIA